MGSHVLDEANDEHLARAAQAGDRESLALLVTRWEGPLFRFVYRLVGQREDARDICQETFLRVVREARRFRPGARFSTWMYQIALNLCRDHLRRKRRWAHVIAEESGEWDGARRGDAPAADAGDPVETLDRERLRTAVMRALATLPAEQREVLILKEYEGLKFREIAAILGCPESTVKSRLYHGLLRLRDRLVADGFASPPAQGRDAHGVS